LHGGILASSYAFCHYYHPLPLFSFKWWFFNKTNYVSFIEIKVKQHIPWNHLWHIANTWTLYDPNKPLQKDNPKTSQNTMAVNTKVMVEILLLSSLPYGKTWTLNMCFTSGLVTCIIMTLLDVSIVSKKLIVTWQNSHLSFKKCMIKMKMPTCLLDN